MLIRNHLGIQRMGDSAAARLDSKGLSSSGRDTSAGRGTIVERVRSIREQDQQDDGKITFSLARSVC